ncbi:uncharacterized protein LOC118438552 [Folsomia candida]|nr:uncharacterized protein LOC118438552 [Folsomia candida]
MVALCVVGLYFPETVGGKKCDFADCIKRTWSYLAEKSSNTSFYAGDGWRFVWQREIDNNTFSAASLVLLVNNDATSNGTTAVLLPNSTILVPSINFDRSDTIWLLGPGYGSHKVRAEKVFSVEQGFTRIQLSNITNPEIILAPATPSRISHSARPPPPTTKCQVYGFQKYVVWWFELLRLAATVLRREKCDTIFNNGTAIPALNFKVFCIKMEILDKQWPERGLRFEQGYSNSREGNFTGPIPVEVRDRYPIFCSSTSNTTWGGGMKSLGVGRS